MSTRPRGLAWDASAADGEPQPPTWFTARMARTCRNVSETLPLFASAALALLVAVRADP